MLVATADGSRSVVGFLQGVAKASPLAVSPCDGSCPSGALPYSALWLSVAYEVQPAKPRASLGRLFANDLVDIDATPDGQVFLSVSRGGTYIIRATLDAAHKLTIGAPNNVIRWQTGNLPNGVVVSHDGRRAYVNNEANVSVTGIDLEGTSSFSGIFLPAKPPVPGAFEHAVLLGKLAFSTALGMPDNGIFDTDIRDIVPLAFRGKQSDNAWSSCGSWHPDGLSDGVTWLFAAGPRQTIPLDGMFAKDTNAGDQRPLNWSAVRGSNADFNNNSRGVQGAAALPALISQPPPISVSPRGQRRRPTPPFTTTASRREGAMPSTCKRCGSLPPSGR
jgi:hypothetical protein